MTTVTLYSIADTYLRKPNPTINYGSGLFLRINGDPTYMGRSLVKYNISSVIRGSNIISAKVRLYCDVSGADNRTVNLYRVLRTDWVESEATWNNYKTGSAWSIAGAWDTTYDRSATLIGSTTFNGTGWIEFTLDLDEFQLMLDNDQHTFLIQTDLYSATSNTEFHSREDTNDPELVIEYTLGGVQDAQAVWFM